MLISVGSCGPFAFSSIVGPYPGGVRGPFEILYTHEFRLCISPFKNSHFRKKEPPCVESWVRACITSDGFQVSGSGAEGPGSSSLSSSIT